MTKKIQDLCVVVSSYTDQSGAKKNRYENVGHVLQIDDGSMILLKRTFNPAGVPNPDGRDTVILSRFDVEDSSSAPAPAIQQQPQFTDDNPF
jgi:hypothetical protein